MRHLISIALILTLAVVLGCAPQEPAPAEQAEPETAAEEPITEEDFESGEPENVVEGTDDEAAEGDVAAEAEPTEEPGH